MNFKLSIMTWYLFQKIVMIYVESWWDVSFYDENLTHGLVSYFYKSTSVRAIKWICTSINMRADNFAILQILIENKCCLVNVYDLIVTASFD